MSCQNNRLEKQCMLYFLSRLVQSLTRWVELSNKAVEYPYSAVVRGLGEAQILVQLWSSLGDVWPVTCSLTNICQERKRSNGQLERLWKSSGRILSNVTFLLRVLQWKMMLNQCPGLKVPLRTRSWQLRKLELIVPIPPLLRNQPLLQKNLKQNVTVVRDHLNGCKKPIGAQGGPIGQHSMENRITPSLMLILRPDLPKQQNEGFAHQGDRLLYHLKVPNN